MPKASAILVGLKQVDPNAYGGWNGENGCWGCELDVDNIKRILSPLGYVSQVLKTAEATKSKVLRALDSAAATLDSGDILVFHYSGHGGQQPDLNGDEGDGQDETLVAYDGQIIDDQLDLVWPKFRSGVRIVMLSDSCNSGTNYRMCRDVSLPTTIKPIDEKAAQAMKAQLIHMGGCRDGFTSSGYASGGAFTKALCDVWNGGRFEGNYKKFYEAVKAAVTTGQVPQYNEYGPVTDSFRNSKPFSVGK